MKVSPKPCRKEKRKGCQIALHNINEEKTKQLIQDVKSLITIINDESFEAKKVELENKENGDVLVINTSQYSKNNLFTPGNADDTIKKTLYVKERYNVSDVAYHEFAMIN